jgi:hypothetical protein
MDEADKILAANNYVSDYFDSTDLDDAMITTALVLLLAQIISYVGGPTTLETVIQQIRETIPVIEELRADLAAQTRHLL